MRPRSVLALICLLLFAVIVSPIRADGPAPTTGQAIHHDTSQPLRDMAIMAAPPTGLSKEVPIRAKPDFGKDPSQAAPDGGLQDSFAPVTSAGPTPAPSASFQGLSDDDNAATIGGRIVPPDTNGDIGLDDQGNKVYLQYINLIWALYSDTGALLAGPFPGNSFWAGFGGFCQANNDGDPVALYDDHAGRWMVSQFSIAQGIQCVAVSTTSDPLGTYHRYAFTVTPGGQNDYPKLGVWDDGTANSTGQSAYTFTLRDFGGTGGSFSVSAGVFERDAMLSGAAAQFVKFSNPCTGADCVEGQLPPHLAGPPPPAGTCPTYWTAVDAAYDDSPFANDGYRNHTLCVDWSNLSNSTYTEGPLVAAGSNFDRFLGNGFSDCINPVNGGEVLDCLAAFTMYRAQYRWFGSEAAVVFNTTVDAGNDRAGIRWAETVSSTGDSNWALGQDGTYAPADGLERWMGSIAQDQDRNIALGYSVTSGSLFPAVRYTSRMASDAAGTMPGGEVSCHEGTGAQIASSNRWGDYSSMSVDPVDDCTFWFTTEYYENTNSFDFKTRICSFKFADCGGGGGPCDNDGTCEEGEDCFNCSNDCPSFDLPGASCGNGLCEAGDGEDCLTCPADCNGKQNGKPANRFCCGFGGQNPVGCADSRCTSSGFSCTETPVGSGGSTCCGDATCEVPEDGFNCSIDCGAPPFCGDGTCDPGEDTCSCAADCGSPPMSEAGFCTDSVDNDCDVDVDCDDADCAGDPACSTSCFPSGDSCTQNSDCCSNKCRGPRGNKTCR